MLRTPCFLPKAKSCPKGNPLGHGRMSHESIESTGIVLYGRYVSRKAKGKKHAIIFWDKIEKNRGAFLNKSYGFKVGEKRYKGLLGVFGGKKHGKSCIVIPVEKREEILSLAKKYKANARIVEV